ncbi:alpha/beta hydrolase family protein [Ruegeria sp. HKCCD7255]|uniref:alpha/beta hydrolase family protein n=1 Tax=Ruegeria sp. HKCCD7255 TaxID=2683004 RepID=UPI00211389A3|nr:alpha/beta hydrolase [Ruegeria sp. HKCCD7255]
MFVAGFGDNGSMFDGLAETHLAISHRLLPINLPGFGAQSLAGRTTLEALAKYVKNEAIKYEAEIIVAHSVASIIASLAAGRADCPLTTIVSVEGNITAADAYFSGTAADYSDPAEFRGAFLMRLDEMAKSAPIIRRYRDEVSKADPVALWQLGIDARKFSTHRVPGEVLQRAANVTYLYNPDDCREGTVRWLEENKINRIVLENATHWPSIDQPEMLAKKSLRRSKKPKVATNWSRLKAWLGISEF